MAKFHIELEHTDWQAALTLINAGGIYASLAPYLIKKMSEQLQVQQQAGVPRAAAGNGEAAPLEGRPPNA